MLEMVGLTQHWPKQFLRNHVSGSFRIFSHHLYFGLVKLAFMQHSMLASVSGREFLLEYLPDQDITRVVQPNPDWLSSSRY